MWFTFPLVPFVSLYSPAGRIVWFNFLPVHSVFLYSPAGRIVWFTFPPVPLLTLAPFALVNSGPCHAAIDYV